MVTVPNRFRINVSVLGGDDARIGNAVVNIIFWQGNSLSYHLRYALSVRVKFALHLYAAYVNTATANTQQSADGVSTHAQLIVNHDAHYRLNILAHVLLADYIVDCAEYALGLILAQIIKQIGVHEDTGEVCNALDCRDVIFALTSHCLAQMIEVTADCTHCVTLCLQVVGVGLQCLGFHLGNILIKTNIIVISFQRIAIIGLIF